MNNNIYQENSPCSIDVHPSLFFNLKKKRSSKRTFSYSRTHATNKGQLQPYKGYEPNYEDFIHAIDRKNDTLYFVSFKRVNFI
jgi:hypothetical protein